MFFLVGSPSNFSFNYFIVSIEIKHFVLNDGLFTIISIPSLQYEKKTSQNSKIKSKTRPNIIELQAVGLKEMVYLTQ